MPLGQPVHNDVTSIGRHWAGHTDVKSQLYAGL